MSAESWFYPLLFVTGLATGLLNVVSGGGSFLSLPILIFMGLPPVMANGTNRVGILAQNVSGFSPAAFPPPSAPCWAAGRPRAWRTIPSGRSSPR